MTNPYDRILDLLGSLPSSDLRRSGKRYGPYKYRRLWQNGKLVDLYEGKATLDEYQHWLAQKAQPLTSEAT